MFRRTDNLDVLSIEQRKTDLTKHLSLTASPRIRLLHIYSFYELLLNEDDEQLKQSHIPEFIESYINLLKQFEPFGATIRLTLNILIQINLLLKEKCMSNFTADLKEVSLKLNTKYEHLLSILNGKETNTSKQCGMYIPLIEKFESESFKNIGLLETLTINIKEEKNETKFLISPSNKEIEMAITEQFRTSWDVALEYVSKYIKIK